MTHFWKFPLKEYNEIKNVPSKAARHMSSNYEINIFLMENNFLFFGKKWVRDKDKRYKI